MGKIKPIDRVEAIKRSRMYAEDYQAYMNEYKINCPPNIDPLGSIPPNIDTIRVMPNLPHTRKKEALFILSDAAKKLCRKYELKFPIEPKTPYHESDLLRLKSPIHYFHPIELIEQLSKSHPDGIMDLKLFKKELASFLDGRLAVMIDTAFSKNIIRDEFDKILYDQPITFSERLRDDSVNIWKVYDMRHIEKKSFIQISVEILQSKGKPATDSEDDRKYQLIKRAYEKACRIIDIVEKDATLEQ